MKYYRKAEPRKNPVAQSQSADRTPEIRAAWHRFLRKPGNAQRVVATFARDAPPGEFRRLFDAALADARFPGESGLAETASWQKAIEKANNGRGQ